VRCEVTNHKPPRNGAAPPASRLPSPALRGELRRNEPMARHTSWRAGGCADRAYLPSDLDDLRAFLASLPQHEPVYLVGLGSNLLVRDGGVRGTVIFTHRVLNQIRVEPEDTGGAEDHGVRTEVAREDHLTPHASRLTIFAEAGVPSPKVARFAAMHKLGGAEFMAGIPGTVGGALAMNAGCYGGETWNIVESATTVDRAGRLHQRTRADYDIGYRQVSLKVGSEGRGVKNVRSGQPAVTPHASRLTPHEEWFVAARFKLPRGDSVKSRLTIKLLLERRIATQPLNQPNAGSVFRNPRDDYAARLIEACGLKGYMLGGAAISDKHANFIVNVGNARAADIEVLIEIAHCAVKQKFGIDLEREVKIIGEA
jgi:UDP-N-acetylmuramate dehydrogenase